MSNALHAHGHDHNPALMAQEVENHNALGFPTVAPRLSAHLAVASSQCSVQAERRERRAAFGGPPAALGAPPAAVRGSPATLGAPPAALGAPLDASGGDAPVDDVLNRSQVAVLGSSQPLGSLLASPSTCNDSLLAPGSPSSTTVMNEVSVVSELLDADGCVTERIEQLSQSSQDNGNLMTNTAISIARKSTGSLFAGGSFHNCTFQISVQK